MFWVGTPVSDLKKENTNKVMEQVSVQYLNAKNTTTVSFLFPKMRQFLG